MRRDNNIQLLDILISARDAMSFAEGMDYAAFEKDRRSQLAMTKCVELVGYAASRVCAEFQRNHPEIPWDRMVRLKNIELREQDQEQSGGDLLVVWRTVKFDFPKLLSRLESLCIMTEDELKQDD